MAAPNIVDVSTITGITTWKAGINTEGAGVSVIVTNAASSGKVLKVNSLVATSIGTTTGVTTKIFNKAAGVGNSVSLGSTMSVPTYSSLAVISKDMSIYLQEDQSIGVFKQVNLGEIDVVCSYEDIS